MVDFFSYGCHGPMSVLWCWTLWQLLHPGSAETQCFSSPMFPQPMHCIYSTTVALVVCTQLVSAHSSLICREHVCPCTHENSCMERLLNRQTTWTLSVGGGAHVYVHTHTYTRASYSYSCSCSSYKVPPWFLYLQAKAVPKNSVNMFAHSS